MKHNLLTKNRIKHDVIVTSGSYNKSLMCHKIVIIQNRFIGTLGAILTQSNMDTSKIKIQIASDVNVREGIGLEIYLKDKLVIEIFRGDSMKTSEITVFDNHITIDLMEFAISQFRKEIPWDFINYSQLDSNG
ncbi:MAG: hypothetical protein R6W78_06320 [Bacteroidales bacterium]